MAIESVVDSLTKTIELNNPRGRRNHGRLLRPNEFKEGSMKKWVVILSIISLAGVLPAGTAAAAGKFKIGVTTIVSHPALEADQKGFEQALADAGLGPDKVEYDYQNAQGEMSNAQQIAQKFKNDKKDLVHAIATPTAQAAVKVITNIPIVYSSVTDPVDAGLVKTMDPDGGNVTGVSDAWDINGQLTLYTQMLPQAKRWGTIYNAGDANSVINVNRLKDAAGNLGLEIVEVTVSNSSEVFTAAQSLAGRVDAVYITSDNTAVSAMEAVAKFCNQADIPLFAGDVDSVARGCIAALGFDYFQVGYTAGKKAALILKGENKAGEIPSSLTENPSLYLNLKAARDQGVTLDRKYIDMAEKIID
jgi:putative tryptophan/tyrosine transport system substrate-binding protein